MQPSVRPRPRVNETPAREKVNNVRIARWQPIALLQLMIAYVGLCLCSGCSLIRVGDPVKHMDLSSEDDAEENLKAVRAMLADEAARSGSRAEQPSVPSVPSEVMSAPTEPLQGTRPLASPSSSTGMRDASARLPWTPSPPERPTVPDRPVPAYATPPPVGPDYSGSIRCAPDGMGGQRCAGR